MINNETIIKMLSEGAMLKSFDYSIDEPYAHSEVRLTLVLPPGKSIYDFSPEQKKPQTKEKTSQPAKKKIPATSRFDKLDFS